MTGEGGCKGTAREGTRDAARTVGMVEMVGTARTMEEMVMEEVMMDYCLQLTIGRARLGTAASHYAARCQQQR